MSQAITQDSVVLNAWEYKIMARASIAPNLADHILPDHHSVDHVPPTDHSPDQNQVAPVSSDKNSDAPNRSAQDRPNEQKALFPGAAQVAPRRPVKTLPLKRESENQLEILSLLGQGGVGQVYLARLCGSSGFSKLVAVKQLRDEYAIRDDLVKDFVREARLGGLFSNHYVVQVIGFENLESKPALIMEYVDGISLDAIIRMYSEQQRTIPTATVLDIGLQIARGLQYIHTLHGESGLPLELVHRDLKPSNILLSREGVVKITDFGIARSILQPGDTTAVGKVKGTLGYMSPEQARGETVDSRSDLYNLGSILFEMATLSPLFTDPSPHVRLRQLMLNQTHGALEQLHLTQAKLLLPLLKSLLTSTADERLGTASEVVTRLQILLWSRFPHYGGLTEFVRSSLELASEQKSSCHDIEDDESRATDEFTEILSPKPNGPSAPRTEGIPHNASGPVNPPGPAIPNHGFGTWSDVGQERTPDPMPFTALADPPSHRAAQLVRIGLFVGILTALLMLLVLSSAKRGGGRVEVGGLLVKLHSPAAVLIDGRSVGTLADTSIELLPGGHEVQMSWKSPDLSQSFLLQVVEGQTTVLRCWPGGCEID